MPDTRAKTERMQIRIDDSSKSKIERAARYSDKTVSEFVIANATAAAERILEEHDQIILSATDWDVFYRALLHPPKPNKALTTAFKRYRRRQGK
ncbi:MAG: DUF1778 domain-containing protein [Blastocatellia bacterium AA13]|nr:MAG: DUF1778 domain-containing protein [Blastocatellia bacterium AA13]